MSEREGKRFGEAEEEEEEEEGEGGGGGRDVKGKRGSDERPMGQKEKGKGHKRHPKRIKGHWTEEEYKVQIGSKGCSTLMPAWGSQNSR